MYTQQPKKMLIINILDILRKYTDEEHRLSQKDILEILENEYDMKVDRKSIKRNLMNLIDFGYDINYSESIRINKNGEEETIYTDWYMDREFNDAELRLLIDSLLFSKHIPYSQCKELVGKLEGLSNLYFRSKVKHICNLPVDMPENKELFLTIEVLDEAIEKSKQVEFIYGDYGADKQLHPRLNSKGEVRRYIINPYQMVATNGRYYLIANHDKYDNISHYRLDRIKDIRLLDIPRKSTNKVEGMEHGLDLPKHMAEHVYMFSGKSERVVIKADKGLVGDILDWFGNGVKFENNGDGTVTATLYSNAYAMKYWALQYSPYMTVISPRNLVNWIRDSLKEALMRYEGGK